MTAKYRKIFERILLGTAAFWALAFIADILIPWLIDVVRQSLWPLLGATAIAILSFAPVGASQDSTGEFCRSLFLVLMISLSLSWVFAVTVTPLLASKFLKKKAPSDREDRPVKDPYAGPFYRAYKGLLGFCIVHRFLTWFVLLALLAGSLYGFTQVKQNFFPDSTRPQFMLHVWMPEGSSIHATEKRVNALSEAVGKLDGVKNIVGAFWQPRKVLIDPDTLKPLVEKYPDNLPLKEALGRAYLKGRQFGRARSQFQDIQKVDPEYPDIQQRIQEASVTRPAPISKGDGLTANLNRAVDSLRETIEPATTHDFTTMLGHYVVRYGATPREFFKKYSIGNFRPVANNVWQESFYIAPYMHTYTVIFDSLSHFREVHVVVYDSASSSNHMGMAPEIYTRLLKQNSRISGIGNSTGETDCGDGIVLDAAVWETQDNFEMLARVVGKPAEVRMVRFDKSVLPPGLKLCDYTKYLNQY